MRTAIESFHTTSLRVEATEIAKSLHSLLQKSRTLSEPTHISLRQKMLETQRQQVVARVAENVERTRRKDMQDKLALAMFEVEKVKVVTSVGKAEMQAEQLLKVEEMELQKKVLMDKRHLEIEMQEMLRLKYVEW